MSTDILLPGLGESITEGTVVRWLKAVGDRVERDEDLVEIETDKITTEVPSPTAGTLLAIVVPAGQRADVGTVIAILGDVGESVARQDAPAASAPTSEVARPAVAPTQGLARAASAPTQGLARAASAPIQGVARPASVPTSTATSAVPAAERSASIPAADADQRNAQARRSGDLKLFVSPVVRRLARQNDVDLSRLSGSGTGGRVTRRDLEAFLAQGGAGTGFTAPPGGYRPGLRIPPGGFGGTLPFDRATPDRFAPEVWPGDRVEPLSGLGRAMAEHMAYTWWRAPHVSTIVEVDMSAIGAHRRTARAAGGPTPSYTACICWALARALRNHPTFNASLTDDHRRVVHGRVNLGVAVARPDGGLLVPVVRDAGERTLDGFGRALGERVDAARRGAIRPDDLRGGTFTMTNVGSNGNLASMPLINQPQVAILAAGAIQKRVVVVTDAQGDDAIAIRPMMYLTLTYDHRANDGAASGRFLKELRRRLESWDPAG